MYKGDKKNSGKMGEENKIIRGLTNFSTEHFTIKLNESEKEQFEKARQAEKKDRQTNYVLGGQIPFIR